MSSIDRFPSGDFLISARHTDAIYKISRATGSILWQLGGVNSSFKLEGFNFSGQHDARVIQENATSTMYIFRVPTLFMT